MQTFFCLRFIRFHFHLERSSNLSLTYDELSGRIFHLKLINLAWTQETLSGRFKIKRFSTFNNC